MWWHITPQLVLTQEEIPEEGGKKKLSEFKCMSNSSNPPTEEYGTYLIEFILDNFFVNPGSSNAELTRIQNPSNPSHW